MRCRCLCELGEADAVAGGEEMDDIVAGEVVTGIEAVVGAVVVPNEA